MTTFLRRFVYLIVDGKRHGTLDLHRINMSRFFNPGSPPAVSAAMVDARLPRPTMTFYGPTSMNFMLIGRDKVLATDQMGSASVYDAGFHAMCAAPAFSRPKVDMRAVSVSVGDRVYVLDASRYENFFEALICEGDGGGTPAGIDDCLPTPPYDPAHVGAYAVVGGSEIWASPEQDGGTYSFDTAAAGGGGAWAKRAGGGAWAKRGDWTLPFSGHAEYVPEYKLWFGLSSKKGSNLLCAFNLAAAVRRQSPPVARNVWEDLRPPKEWRPFSSNLVHLGSGRFCIARSFCDWSKEPCDFDGYRQTTFLAVFTAVEVVPYSSKGLRMIKHGSECYNLGDHSLQHWML